MARIFVVGAGVVGTAVGRAFVEAGHHVTLVDVAPERVEQLREDGFDAAGRLDLRGEPSAFVLLTVPTPAGAQGYDLRAVAGASEAVGAAIGAACVDRRTSGRHRLEPHGLEPHGLEPPGVQPEVRPLHTIVVRSTVPPGTTTQLVGPAIARASGTTEGVGFALAASPVFLRAASAADDARWPWLNVVGATSRRVAERLKELLEPLGGEVRVVDRPETAELVKCAHNLVNAAKISFWNEMWLVATRLGLDPNEVAGIVAQSAEASTNRLYGIHGGAPFAGRSLGKDADGFLAFARELGLPMPMLDAALAVNRSLAEHAVRGTGHGAGRRPRVLDLRDPGVPGDHAVPAARHPVDLLPRERR